MQYTDGKIGYVNGNRGAFVLDKSGWTTQRMSNTEINSSYKNDSSKVFRSGVDREHFIRNVVTVASGVMNQNAAQAALNGQLQPYVGAAVRGGDGSEWALAQAISEGHKGMFHMEGTDIQAAAVKAAASVEGKAAIDGIDFAGFGAAFKTSLSGELAGTSQKSNGVDMVAHVYKAGMEAAGHTAERAGYKKGSAAYNKYVASTLSAMTSAFEGEARGKRGYGVGVVTGDGPTGKMPNVEAPMPRSTSSRNPHLGPPTSTIGGR